MGEVIVTITQPPPPPPTRVTLEVDKDTARALKVLAGLGLVHVNDLADDVARRNGFKGMNEVRSVLVKDKIWENLRDAGL